MLRIALLCLALSGLRAAPLAPRVSHVEGLAGAFRHSAEPSPRLLPDDYRQGIEPARHYVVDLNTGRVLEHVSEMERRVNPVATRPDVAEVSAEIERHWLDEVEIPVQRSGAGWVRVEEHFEDNLPKGFRQGTERMASIPEGFRQGTEPTFSMPEGFRQGTEPMMSIPEGFRQGTKSISSIPDGFRQGTEPMASIPDGYRQGTEPTFSMPEGFRQGTEPRMSIPEGFRQGTEPTFSMPEGFRQGAEPMVSILDGFRQGTKSISSIPDGFRQGTEPMASIPDGYRQGTEPTFSMPEGFRQGTEPRMSIPEGFRQGTEPRMSIPEGFRQGTEPMMSIPDGFRKGTKSIPSIPDGFRQGTEPMASIPDGYRQGTEPTFSMPEGFRQGTEPMVSILDGFRQGTEPMMSFPEGFRQGTEHSSMALGRRTPECKGKIIMGRCYQFNPTPLSFKDAQATCRDLAPNSDLASITDGSLHSGLVSMVTKDGEDSPVLTWLGGVVKNQQAQWLDGSEMAYSDWMKGHPNVRSAKPVCLEMFRMDESWWSTVDCEFLRASICSYPVVA
ncbi:uncharacterized protein LOC115543059 isoform X1 [Gadus morhua]|nr:uncharacterized protein LOC115543059 isoform X1 [Gadus morhua]